MHWIKGVISLWKSVYSLKMSSFCDWEIVSFNYSVLAPHPPSFIPSGIWRKSERCSSKCIISILQITDPLFLNEFFHAGASFLFTFRLFSLPLLAFPIFCFIIFQPRHPRPLCACDLPLIFSHHVSASYLLFFPPVSVLKSSSRKSDQWRITSMLLWNNFVFLTLSTNQTNTITKGEFSALKGE